MSKILSIIVPTYNMEKYLHKCLSSVIVDDTELLSRLEVIIVNDGSKDSSSSIAHSFETDYPGIFRVVDKTNANYGSCINAALPMATGQYIKVLDADDSFEKKEFSLYLQVLCSTDADMVICRKLSVGPNGDILTKHPVDLPANQILYFDNIADNMQILDMHKMAYRRTLLLAMNYRQSEGVSYSDIEWTVIPFSMINTAVYLPYDVYQYLQGRDGQTVDSSVRSRSLASLRVIQLSLGDYLRHFQGSEKRKRFIFDKFVFNVLYLYREFFFKGYYDKEEFRSLDSELISLYPEIKPYIDNHQWVSFIPNLHLASDWREKRIIRFAFEYSLIRIYLFLSVKHY